MIDAPTAALQLRQRVFEPMKEVFVGKDGIIDLMGVALAAGENLFLLGPPGTAKTALVHEMTRRLGAKSFDYLLTRFTEPNELFGPFDIRRLREGELVTNTAGMLPEADVVFLDELLNANSAILNGLLMVLNERVFRRGAETRAVPALMVVGASNQLPEDEALRALFDRFLLRVRCGPVTDEQLGAVLAAGWVMGRRESAGEGPGAEMVREIQRGLMAVSMDGVREELIGLVRRLRAAGVVVSDRRAVRLQRAVAGSALMAGRGEARLSDLWVLAHVWDREEQMEMVAALVRAVVEREGMVAGDHPGAGGGGEPDAEALARELDGLESRWGAGLADPAAGDVLRLLAERVQWVRVVEARERLEAKCRELWARRAGGPD
jgi:MoxR-like ATPase